MPADLTVDLSGRIAFITGASSGIGAHFARLLAKSGAQVILAARRLDALNALVTEIDRNGGKARAIALDLRESASIRAAAENVGAVDILVNNAGIVRNKPAFEQTEDDWDDVLDTNLKGMFLTARDFAAQMRAAKRGGSIINIASVLGLRQAGQVLPYAVSKAGVLQLTKVLALELARFGIRVNALAPGYLDTELNRDFWSTEAGQALIRRIPQRRLGALEDLDGPLLLLASDASRYMTGSIITVDGGHLVSTL